MAPFSPPTTPPSRRIERSSSPALLLVLVLSVASLLLGCSAVLAQQAGAPAGTTPIGTRPLRGGAPCVLPRHHKAHPQQPPAGVWGSFARPLPTNDWWTNFVSATLNRAGTSPVKTWPLMVRPAAAPVNGLEVSLPLQMTQDTYTSDTFVFNVALGARETLASRSLRDFSKLHATMRVAASDQNAARIDFPVARGMPYVTGIYGGSSVRPRFSTIHAILRANGRGFAIGQTYAFERVASAAAGVSRLKLELNNGQTWILYAMEGSAALSLRADTASSLVSDAAWTGTLRLTGFSTASLAGTDAATAESVLDRHSGTYARGGRVALSVKTGATTDSASGERFDAGVVTYDWQTGGPGSANDLLMMAMPHHMDMLTDVPRVLGIAATANVAPVEPALRMTIVRGQMRAMRGARWVLLEPRLTNTGFFAKFNLPNDAARTEVMNAVREDLQRGPGAIAPDPYFGGKQIAKVARVAIIAAQLGMENEARQLRAQVKTLMDPWFGTDVGDQRRLRYEHTYGGVVSYKALDDPGAEFGMGWYNDHHFHFGYFVYSAAVLLRDEPNWPHRDAVLDLVRDYMSPVRDAHFPEARGKDWYLGHSHANGLFDFADSKNQESTSEAINAYYAVSLFGRAIGDRDLMDVGRLALAQEIRATQIYWHMPSYSTLYPERFRKNRVVGVLWESKSEYATFFGNNVEFIHGIQYIPFIPVSDELLPARYLRDAWPVVSTAFSRATPPLSEGWKGLLYLAQCIFDKPTGLANVRSLRGYDDGNTKTNTLYTCHTVAASGMSHTDEPPAPAPGPAPTPGPEPIPVPAPEASFAGNGSNATNATGPGDASAGSQLVSWGTIVMTLLLMFSLFIINKLGIHYFYGAGDVHE